MGPLPTEPEARTGPTDDPAAAPAASACAEVLSHGCARWLAATLRPYVGRHLLHVDADVGGLAEHLQPQASYTACAAAQEAVQRLAAAGASRAHFAACWGAAEAGAALPRRSTGYDTVLWLQPRPLTTVSTAALARLRETLAVHGRIVLVQIPGARRPADVADTGELDAEADAAGLVLRQRRELGRLETPVQRLLQRWSRLGGAMPAAVRRWADRLRPAASRLDTLWPWPGAFRVAVLTHRPALARVDGLQPISHPARTCSPGSARHHGTV